MHQDRRQAIVCVVLRDRALHQQVASAYRRVAWLTISRAKDKRNKAFSKRVACPSCVLLAIGTAQDAICLQNASTRAKRWRTSRPTPRSNLFRPLSETQGRYCIPFSKKNKPATGIEPITVGLQNRYSTSWAKQALCFLGGTSGTWWCCFANQGSTTFIAPHPSNKLLLCCSLRPPYQRISATDCLLVTLCILC